MKLFGFVVAIILALAIVIPVLADEGVEVSANVGQEEIHVGDVVPITLAVHHPQGWRVIFPALDKKWGDLEVRTQNSPHIEKNTDGSETTMQVIDVTYFRPGAVTVPGMELSVADDRGQVERLAVEPIELNVKSVLQPNDTTLRDIKPQVELWQLSSSPIPFLASLALAFTVLGGAGVWAWKHRPVTDKRTPRERALDDLKAVGSANLLENDVKTYCVRVSDILREYLTHACGLDAADLTTRELAQLIKDRDVPANFATQIIYVCRVADTVKFANDSSDHEAIATLASITQQIVLLYPPVNVTSKRGGKR